MKISDSRKISRTWTSKIVPWFFSVVFSYVFIVFLHFSGPAVVPPTKGTEKGIFSRNLQLGLNCSENEGFPTDFVKNRPWIFHHGFLLHSYCNFSLLGLGRGPPQKGGWKEHFSEEFSIGAELLQNHMNFSHFPADSGEGESQTGQPQNQSKIRGKQSKA